MRGIELRAKPVVGDISCVAVLYFFYIFVTVITNLVPFRLFSCKRQNKAARCVCTSGGRKAGIGGICASVAERDKSNAIIEEMVRTGATENPQQQNLAQGHKNTMALTIERVKIYRERNESSVTKGKP